MSLLLLYLLNDSVQKVIEEFVSILMHRIPESLI